MTEQFKLPGSSWVEVNKIIKGYAELNKPSSIAAISKAVGMSPTTVSRNSNFLISIGVIEPGAKKAPTEIGKRLGMALMHEAEDEVKQTLFEIVAETEFLKNLVGAVRIRKGMDDSTLKSHIAYSADAKKNSYTTAGAGTIAEILKLSGHLKDEDGKIVVGTPVAANYYTSSTDAEVRGAESNTSDTADGSPKDGFRVSLSPSTLPFQISISIEVKCSVDDLDTLGERLCKVMDDLQRGTEAENAERENLTE